MRERIVYKVVNSKTRKSCAIAGPLSRTYLPNVKTIPLNRHCPLLAFDTKEHAEKFRNRYDDES